MYAFSNQLMVMHTFLCPSFGSLSRINSYFGGVLNSEKSALSTSVLDPTRIVTLATCDPQRSLNFPTPA